MPFPFHILALLADIKAFGGESYNSGERITKKIPNLRGDETALSDVNQEK